MSRRSRRENSHLKDQDTVGMRRTERQEQEELVGKRKIEAAAERQRIINQDEKKRDINAHPPRVARVGKPLKR